MKHRSLTCSQITDPANQNQMKMTTVSSGDYSFEAKMDGKYVYCFSNEHWSANSKEVSFNVHGIVYVPESDTPSDPLDAEGKSHDYIDGIDWLTTDSASAVRGPVTGQGRASLHCCPRAHSQKHGREHKLKSKVVVNIPTRCLDRRGHLPSLVAQEILRGQESCMITTKSRDMYHRQYNKH